jgi:hypothetical protein
MKGIVMGVEFITRLLITVFIIGVIVILLWTFLPHSFGQFCKQKQFESINEIFSDSIGARSSTTVKGFSVESCMDYVEFKCIDSKGEASEESCDKSVATRFKGEAEQSRAFPDEWEPVDVFKDGKRNFKLEPGIHSIEVRPYEINFIK